MQIDNRHDDYQDTLELNSRELYDSLLTAVEYCTIRCLLYDVCFAGYRTSVCAENWTIFRKFTLIHVSGFFCSKWRLVVSALYVWLCTMYGYGRESTFRDCVRCHPVVGKWDKFGYHLVHTHFYRYVPAVRARELYDSLLTAVEHCTIHCLLYDVCFAGYRTSVCGESWTIFSKFSLIHVPGFFCSKWRLVVSALYVWLCTMYGYGRESTFRDCVRCHPVVGKWDKFGYPLVHTLLQICSPQFELENLLAS